jgi:hypothetical protein
MSASFKHTLNILLFSPVLVFGTASQTVDATDTATTATETPQKIQDNNIKITLPTVPKPPEVIMLNGNSTIGSDRSIKFSKRIPPDYIPHGFDNQNEVKSTGDSDIGKVIQGKISAYLRGEFMDVKSVEEKLKDAGFQIVASIPLDKEATLTSVVFTDKSLIAMSSKERRGFMASLRVLVDTEDKSISFINPLYAAKGFLQQDFNETSAKEILAKLLSQFPDLQNSRDTLKFQLLSNYQFMTGMPHYEEMIEVAKGDNLLEKITDNKQVLFVQNLENGSTLIGVELSRRTNTFTKKIGRNNVAMLPYPILIENGKAKILDPKYYIAYMYPMLKMSEFMSIASIPDAIIKDCEKIFKKKK